MKEYWNNPEETAKTLRDGWLSTGDIAYMDTDGHIFIVDRKKDMVLSSGFNVYPREIDEADVHPSEGAAGVFLRHPRREARRNPQARRWYSNPARS